MYKVDITEELNLESYTKFIDYSFSKSDAFMLVTYRENENIELMFSEPSINLSLNEEIRLMILKSNEEAKKIKYKDIGIFKERTEPFLGKLQPYLIKKRNYPTEWPGIKVVLNEYTNVDICVYKVCDEVKPYLLEPKGLFNWKYPYFPDDLSFFKGGYCWFTIVAHEGFACMYIKNDDDIRNLKELGMDFNVTEHNDNEKSLFYEEYNI